MEHERLVVDPWRRPGSQIHTKKQMQIQNMRMGEDLVFNIDTNQNSSKDIYYECYWERNKIDRSLLIFVATGATDGLVICLLTA